MIVADWQTWNDYTVPRLAQTIFDDKRFDLAPILADALEEAGHPDASLPANLRAASPVTVVHLLAPIIGGELAKSVAWIEAHAKKLGPGLDYQKGHTGMTYEDLMGFAAEFLKTGEVLCGEYDGFQWSNNFDPVNFWKHYKVVTGESADDRWESFFECCL